MSNSAAVNAGCYGAASEKVPMAKPQVKLPRRSKDSVAFHRDPFNKPELVHTLRGKELLLFVLLYALGVLAIIVLFESVMPVFFLDEGVRAEQKRRAAIAFGQVKTSITG